MLGFGKQVPPGTICMYGGTTAPPGWIMCMGGTASRTQYPALFNIFGTRYGAGDGSTTFGLPNFVGRVPVGLYAGDTDFAALGNVGGEKTHVLTTAEIPPHNHSTPTNLVNASGGGTATTVASGSSYGYGYGAAYNTGNTGGNTAHNNMPNYVVINFIVKT